MFGVHRATTLDTPPPLPDASIYGSITATSQGNICSLSMIVRLTCTMPATLGAIYVRAKKGGDQPGAQMSP